MAQVLDQSCIFGPRKPKIGNFNLSLVLCNQKIAWFQVSVHDPSLVAMQKALKHLPDDRFEVGHGQWLALSVEILLHIQIEEFKYQVKFVFSVDNINEVDNSWMAQLS